MKINSLTTAFVGLFLVSSCAPTNNQAQNFAKAMENCLSLSGSKIFDNLKFGCNEEGVSTKLISSGFRKISEEKYSIGYRAMFYGGKLNGEYIDILAYFSPVDGLEFIGVSKSYPIKDELVRSTFNSIKSELVSKYGVGQSGTSDASLKSDPDEFFRNNSDILTDWNWSLQDGEVSLGYFVFSGKYAAGSHKILWDINYISKTFNHKNYTDKRL